VTEGGANPVLVHRVIARLNVGGPAMHVVNLAEGLDADGHFRTRLIAGTITGDEGDMGYYARGRGVELTHLPALSRLISPLNDLKILWFLFRLFRRERPTIVHTHTAKAGILGRIAASLAGVPIRIHTFHGHVLGGDYFSPAITRFYLEVERQLARLSTRLVVLTERQRVEMSGELGVAPEERFSVIPLGLKLGEFRDLDREGARTSTRAALGLSEDEIVVGIVGRLVPVKNHELLFQAQPLLEKALGQPVQILVVGSGLREGELKEYVRGLEIEDRVRWLGWRQDLPELYSAMDALALTSFDEGTPVAVLEALASGTPVAARAVGGVPEILEGVPLASLIQEPTGEAVAAAIMKVLGREVTKDELRVVRDDTVERYSVGRLVHDVAQLYQAELTEVS
jgi:glycosyltransferase involved in cell wall biosynthesis